MANEFSGVPMDAFEPPKMTFILGNGSPVPLYPTYGGNGYDVPPRNVIGAKPGMTIDGLPIPGTRLIEDAYKFNDSKETMDGVVLPGEPYVIPAAEIIQRVLGYEPKEKVAKSDMAHRGLTWIPNNSTMERATEILDAAEKRYKVADLADARKLITVYNKSVETLSRAGLPTVVSSGGIPEAIAKIKAADAELLSNYTAPDAPAAELDDLEFEVYAKSRVLDLINRTDPKASQLTMEAKLDMASQIMSDPKIKAQLRREGWLVKKVGAPTASEMRRLEREAKVAETNQEEVAVPMEFEGA